MSETAREGKAERQLVLFEVERREVTVAFDGGDVVTDTGLLLIRELDRELGVLSEAAARLPDPRSTLTRTFSTEDLLTQTVYQLLGGYFDSNDAQTLRHDPLLQVLVDRAPGPEQEPLASGSTLARFKYGYTRRQQRLPVEDRTIEQECQAAKCARLRNLNQYLVELFINSRRERPARIILDIDATDDPAHGEQQLTLFHGYYGQNQYLPLLVFDGDTKFPLAGWLRSGTAHPTWGAVEVLTELVAALRQAWPGIEILVRADTGYASPAVYEFCETHDVHYVIGYARNAVLVRETQVMMNYVQAVGAWYEEPRQQFQNIPGYQAEDWSRPRRIIAKCEWTAQGGANRRFIVTDLTGPPAEVYREVYVQRGDGPERAIQELKHGLSLDRLSSHRFFANAFTLQCHLLAYALYVLFREANAEVPEVADHTLETVRSKLLKVGAVVQTSARRIWFHVSASWPRRTVFLRASAAVREFARSLGRLWPDRLAEGLSIKLGGTALLLK